MSGILTCQSVSAKIGYYQRITANFAPSPIELLGLEKIEPTDDGTFNNAAIYGTYNNWFPYLTLADCEELCRASSTCVNAMYEFNVPGYMTKWGPAPPKYHGVCFLNSGLPGTNGLPKVFPKQDPGETRLPDKGNSQLATRMTITKSDKGRFD